MNQQIAFTTDPNKSHRRLPDRAKYPSRINCVMDAPDVMQGERTAAVRALQGVINAVARRLVV